MPRARRDEYHVVRHDGMACVLDDQQALAGFHDVDVVGPGMPMHPPTRSVRLQDIQVYVETLDSDAGIDEADRFAAPRLQQSARRGGRLDDLERHVDSRLVSRPVADPLASSGGEGRNAEGSPG